MHLTCVPGTRSGFLMAFSGLAIEPDLADGRSMPIPREPEVSDADDR